MRVAPRCAYRVQLRKEFDFAAAATIVPYLHDLGVTHLYCSPYMQAAPGSPHGYDVVDPTRVSAELGGDAGLASLDAALRTHGMGQLLDIVPNHMCVSSPDNRLWWDVLRHGRDSQYAHFFDIDWGAPGLEGRVLLPVLGDPLEEVLQRGELKVARGDGGDWELRYHEQRFPLNGASDAADSVVTAEALAAQHYVLEHWRTGLPRINYRRFFDVSSLAGVRVEQQDVFQVVQQRALELVRDGVVDGLRVDHVDGLRDPGEYLERLRAAAPQAWVIVEKILGAGETLPDEWPVDGTTGYEFIAHAAALSVDPAGSTKVRGYYAEFTGDGAGFSEVSRESRLQVLRELLHSELERLVRVAAAAGLPDAAVEMAELLAGMPVYRMYPRARVPRSAQDAAALETARSAALRSGRCGEARLNAIVAVIAGESQEPPAARELRERFQQVSSAVMAKGVEDTAFYRYVPMVALNEVGSDPCRVPDVAGLHAVAAESAQRRPLSLLATATHDTKRGEDARVRVAMLSEMPDTWRDAVQSWHELAARYRGARAPSRSDEYLLYETLVAAHPLDADRAAAYILKAAREAKRETSWLDPDAEYETGLDTFVRGVTGDAEICAAVDRFVAAMTPAWQVASLSQTLLKLTSPGVPDIYQGCELWDLHLVDPDNRTPVDYELRRRLLRDIDGMSVREIMRRSDEGLPKLHLVRTALRVRASAPDVFEEGSWYQPLQATGDRAAHAVAYMRGREQTQAAVVSVVVRLARALGGDWGATSIELPRGGWRNAFTGAPVDGGTVALATLLQDFPVALLVRAR